MKQDNNGNNKNIQNETQVENNDVNGFISDVIEENNLSDDYEETPVEGDGINLADTVKQSEQGGKRKNTGRKGLRWLRAVIWVAVILIISFSIAGGIIVTAIDVFGISLSDNNEVEVVIESGASTEQIANKLKDSGVIKYPFIFKIYSRLLKFDGTYKYGVYYIKPSGGYSDICEQLQTAGSQAKEVEVVIPDGAGINDIMKIFEKKKICNKSEFKKAMEEGTYDYDFVAEIPGESVYYLLEGYLPPDTYRFYLPDESTDNVEAAERAINKMLKQMKTILDEAENKAKESIYSIHEILSLASIVELEASGMPDEMKKVAQVFYNRLEGDEFKGARFLGSTPTSKYISSRYNTNVYEGLPPGPLCSPSKAAIEAALSPDSSVKATYFVTDKNMKFYFTNSLAEHNRIIAKLKNDGMWEY